MKSWTESYKCKIKKTKDNKICLNLPIPFSISILLDDVNYVNPHKKHRGKTLLEQLKQSNKIFVQKYSRFLDLESKGHINLTQEDIIEILDRPRYGV